MALLTLHTIFLGIIEGFTEFVPVSSTAHLLLAGQLLHIDQGPFLEVLSISIQSGAILAALCYFWRTVWGHRALIGKIAIAFIPTGVAGLVLYPVIKPLLENNGVIALALILGGIALVILTPNDEPGSVAAISYRQALLIGIVQIASFIPGVSRAGATLIGGTLLGIPRSVIVPFSFLLAIPTILGASVVELRHAPALAGNQWTLIVVAGVVAFLVALATIRFFLTLLTTKPLSWFGWYRIALGIVVLIVLI